MKSSLQAIAFDAYGTLFDVHCVTRLADGLFPGQGAALSRAWRGKQLEYTWLRSLMGRYIPFGEVTGEALDWALDSLGIVASAPARSRLLDAYRTLDVFPDVRGALATLAARQPLAVLSNGQPDMLDAVIDHHELRVYFGERVFSAHAAGVFKPDPRVYALVTEQFEAPPGAIGFVSSNGWDVAGAKAFGLRSFWVNRSATPMERLGQAPEAVFGDLEGLVAATKES